MAAIGLTIPMIAVIANVPVSTLGRRLKSAEAFVPVAWERIDRLAQVAVLAEDVFEEKDFISRAASSSLSCE